MQPKQEQAELSSFPFLLPGSDCIPQQKAHSAWQIAHSGDTQRCKSACMGQRHALPAAAKRYEVSLAGKEVESSYSAVKEPILCGLLEGR